jgi:nucleoside-diphosphate-sugar epimerase
MRIFVAGASGVIGRQLVPLLLADGHVVGGMTRSPERVRALQALGVMGVVADVYDRAALGEAVGRFHPDVVVNELTDLPDDPHRLSATMAANNRMRREGATNLLQAAQAAGAARILVQSVAWDLPGDAGAAVADLERETLEAGGVIVRYGRLYGPGTYYPAGLPDPPRVHVADAARGTVALLQAEPGVYLVAE